MKAFFVFHLLTSVGAVYFHVSDRKPAVFRHDVEDQQVITLKYKHIDNPGIACNIVFRNPKNLVVYEKTVAETEESGTAAFVADAAGLLTIEIVCLPGIVRSSKLKWQVHIDVGEHNDVKAARPQDISDFNKGVRRAAHALSEIKGHLHRARTTTFQQLRVSRTSERWTIYTAVLLFTVTFFSFVLQNYGMYAALKAEKLI